MIIEQVIGCIPGWIPLPMNNTGIATCETASGAVGETPISTAHFLIKGVWHPIRLKLEGCNPAGSIKDRTAAYLISDLESRGTLNSSSIIVESNSNLIQSSSIRDAFKTWRAGP